MELPLDWNILVSNLLHGDLNVFYPLFVDDLRNVLPEILDSIVISHNDFLGDVLNLSFLSVFHFLGLLGYPLHHGLLFILHYLLFEWNILYPAFALYNFLTHIHSSPRTVVSQRG